ncbi:SH3 domain-containing protein [Asticcacaulis sp. BYS171W]|uniref:SH3 domain-containing protein n=1 Tax=Asticcacaulis aquaticus TaxID=2984212 RepID=A0ABT5HXM2_9CAUL|nr:SH3 domain-containing protein [Asticcacaulis aquaticus]MDC7684820.1 SH3 domain-containing protein [Asticcacaulis aquaticus]
MTLFSPSFAVKSPDHSAGPCVKARRWTATFLLTLLLGSLMTGAALAGPEDEAFDTPSKQPVPRWASLRSNKVYARSGPTKENKVLWTYTQKNLPVQIISETKEWRMICDPDGGIAWVSKTMLKSQRSVISTGTAKIDLLSGPKATAKVKARLNPRALATLDKCKKDYCKVTVGNVDGWAPQKSLWGAQDGAVCKRPDALTRLS